MLVISLPAISTISLATFAFNANMADIKDESTHEGGRKTRIHISLDEEVPSSLREEGFNISALANKLLKEHLEKVKLMKSLFEFSGGPAGIRTPDLHLVRVAS